jgi:branched-chain amino acid transport system ATP-binding protein
VRQNLARAFDMFPVLADRKRQNASTLSGGEQQMLAIARGLMSDPALLMLDEPSTGLSPMVVESIFDVVGRLGEQGTTTLLVEQNVHLALAVADRAYVLERGRVALEGRGSELRENPAIRQAYLGIADG